MLDLPWGIVAGGFAGFGVSATVAAFFLIGEILPHSLWYAAGLSDQAGAGFLILWSVLALLSWFVIGVITGAIFAIIGPLRRHLVEPIQAWLAAGMRAAGLATLSTYWSPPA